MSRVGKSGRVPQFITSIMEVGQLLKHGYGGLIKEKLILPDAYLLKRIVFCYKKCKVKD